MKEDRPLTREEIEDILDRVHITEYEWYIDDKDDSFCSSSEEDAELVEKAIKGLINQYQNDYISKDKIKEIFSNKRNEIIFIRNRNERLDKVKILDEIEKLLLEE